MANNRLWLMHRPSGKAVCLGKRMGVGWYRPPDKATLEAFYQEIEDLVFAEGQDDFILLQEDTSGAPGAYNGEWRYHDNPAGGIIPVLK